MASVRSFPHYEIRVKDRSIFEPVSIDQLPLFRPLMIMKAQKGPVGTVEWYPTYADALDVFGSKTFDKNSDDYFSMESYFVKRTMENSGAFIARVAPNDAEAAVAVLEARVSDEDIVQYQKDSYGNRIVDSNGDWVPLQDGGSVVTEPGVAIEWAVRPLEAGETISSLTVETIVDSGVDVTVYPIIAFEASSPGLWGDNVAFAFYYNKDINTQDTIERSEALYYTLVPVEKETETSTLDPVWDIYKNRYTDAVLKAGAVDASTNLRISFQDKLESNYRDGVLPFTPTMFYDNMEAVANRVIAVHSNSQLENLGIRDPDTGINNVWLVNIISGMDLEGGYYDLVKIRNSDTVDIDAGDRALSTYATDMKMNTYHYLTGGVDGDLSEESVFEMIENFVDLNVNPDITDKARYPFTHLFDTGLPLELNGHYYKESLLSFLNTRDDVKVVISTQDRTNNPNTKEEDHSTARALSGIARAMLESVHFGTGGCRATIFSQCGNVVDEGIAGNVVPATLWSAMKHAEYQNGLRLDQVTEGLPNAAIDIFKEINWTPSGDEMKALMWEETANYAQYYDMSGLHYPSVRTVYDYDSSVLANDLFTDAIVYTKHAIRRSWAIHVGRSDEFLVLKRIIETDLTDRLTTIYNGKYQFTVNVYQTEEEQKIGYIHHVEVNITSPATSRVWIVDIVCNREGYTAE